MCAGRSEANHRAWDDGQHPSTSAGNCCHALKYENDARPSIPNLQPRFNACPTDPAGTIVERWKARAGRDAVGLVPFSWEAAQGTASRYLQRSRGDRHDKALVQKEGAVSCRCRATMSDRIRRPASSCISHPPRAARPRKSDRSHRLSPARTVKTPARSSKRFPCWMIRYRR
jgi:hypothetical protein